MFLVQRLLASASVAVGAALGAEAALPSGDSPVLLLSMGSLVSIGLGFYWYGRLTERVKSEQELREKLELRVKELEDNATEPEVVDRMVNALERLDRNYQDLRLQLRLPYPTGHDSAYSPPSSVG